MPLTKYDFQKGCFVLAGTINKLKCKCPPNSPFHWAHTPRPSIFMADQYFRVTSTGVTQSEAATASVERARAEGINAGLIKGISRKHEEEILRMRNFAIYAQPVLHGKPQRKTTNN